MKMILWLVVGAAVVVSSSTVDATSSSTCTTSTTFTSTHTAAAFVVPARYSHPQQKPKQQQRQYPFRPFDNKNHGLLYQVVMSASSSDNINNNNDDENENYAWDANVDYDKVWENNNPKMEDDENMIDAIRMNPNKNVGDLKKVFSPEISELLDDATKEQLKAEARDIIDAKVKEGMDALQKMRLELQQDVEFQKRRMERSSAARAELESKRLLSKIDALTDGFLSNESNRAIRESTKLAAAADAAMEGTNRGVELGSWGILNSGMTVTTAASRSSSSTSFALLGSVESVKNKSQQQLQTDQDTASSSTTRILIIADETGDPVAKKLLPPLKEAMQETLKSSGTTTSSIDVQVYKPTQQMPLGGNNAVCVIFFLTSLSNSPKPLLERLLRRTMNTMDSGSGGTIGIPPTQFLVISTLGTERTNKFPYTVQNLFQGGALDQRRTMEEYFISMVKNKDRMTNNYLPPLDYTIVKFGDLQPSASSLSPFAFESGDVLDGTTCIDTAVAVLLQAMAFQPSARNSTLCVTGTLPPPNWNTKEHNDKDASTDETMMLWDDLFLKLVGPELVRYESLNLSTDLYVQLTEYLKEWGQLLAMPNTKGSKKLTTPVDYVVSRRSPNAIFEGVVQRDGFQLLFRPTNTGNNYLSKEEERELEQRGLSPKSATNQRRNDNKDEGGMEVLVEVTTRGLLRVRATRTNMGPNTIVKELSETTMLKRLEECLSKFVQEYA